MILQDLITRAYREAQVIDEGIALEGYQSEKARDLFNDLVPDLLQNACGRRLVTYEPYITSNTSGQCGYRYMANTAGGSFTLTFPAYADDGQMVGVTDAQERFDEHGLTIDPGTNLLDGVRGIDVIATEGFSGEWFFRSEAGWTLIEPLELEDGVYFPADIISALTTLLAVRLLPFGETLAAAPMAYATFVRRYGRRGRSMTDPPISYITSSAPKRATAG